MQIADWSTDDDRLPSAPPAEGRAVGSIDVRFLTEGAIRSALLDAVAAAGSGDELSFAVHALSDRQLISAALRAAERGVRLKILLDPHAPPNRAVAGELTRGGGGLIEVRWLAPAGVCREDLPRHRPARQRALGQCRRRELYPAEPRRLQSRGRH